jgi:pimeloyl-ACP methyl ester carboxylesterase
MDGLAFLETPQRRRIAYRRRMGRGPGVVFLGGFKSDMEGTKAQALDALAAATGRAFLRFDYSGHGVSSGLFEEGAIGDWAEDAMAAIGALTEGPQVLVGSSMGGWIALLVAKAMPARVAGLIGIAAAPDFTEDSLWDRLTEAERDVLLRDGRMERASAYCEAPYVYTRRLIEDGRRHLVLRAPLRLACPVRLLQGTADEDVPVAVAERLFAHIEAPDAWLTLVKGADHRFSTPGCLRLIEATVAEITVEEA